MRDEDVRKPLCLLLVDDHEDSLHFLGKLLTSAGYGVLLARSFDEAVSVAQANRCDLLVSDIGLPGRTGLELMRELGQRFGLKGIAVSGYAFPADIDASQTAGFDFHLAKPIQFAELIKAIEDLTAQLPPAPSIGGNHAGQAP